MLSEKGFGYLEAGVARLRLGVVWHREVSLVALEPGDAVAKSETQEVCLY